MVDITGTNRNITEGNIFISNWNSACITVADMENKKITLLFYS